MSATNGVSDEIAPYIDVRDLSYAFPDGSSGLQHVILNLPAGSRTLLIGGTFHNLPIHHKAYIMMKIFDDSHFALQCQLPFQDTVWTF